MDLANSTFRDPIVVQASAGKYHARLQWAGAGRLTLGWTYPGNLGRPTTAAPADQVIDLGDGTTGDTVVAGKQGGGHVPDSLVFTNATTTLSVSGTTVARTDLATHTPQSPLIAQGTAVAGGFSDDGRLFWLASECNGIRFWRTADWSLAMTLYLIKGQHYFVFAPSGRYDTNHAPDTDEFRWLVRDAPLQSLGPQTFMRDYFKPRLAALALDGSEANDPIPSIRSLNRVLPQVLFTGVDPGPTPDTALVHLGVLQGVDASAANGKTRSGIYNLRLFRDNALIAQWPATAPAENTDLATWQQANALTPDAQGYVNVTYLAHLPTGARTARTTFSAYAFNSDRVKSDTVRQVYRRPAIAPRPPRAYVLTIGINRYAQSRLQLHFAVNDAQLLARRLAQLPGYDVRQVTLASEQADRPVTKAAIAAALDLLAGGDRTTDLAKLAAAGADGDAFAQATPDDLVMITFSGHGWADPHSNFYLLPADAQWPDSAPTPDTGTLVSSAEIATWLRNIDAGAMALVIDACHSAASVATSGFRPGPMGDSGLGQLAYDKGIRLLAASQADDVAMEDAALQQGLLTYALADEGLNASGFGLADLNHDGRIMLDEWLRYALHRLPSLSTDAQAHRFGNGMGAKSAFTVISDSQALPARSQDPALFDFNVHPSTDALRIRTP